MKPDVKYAPLKDFLTARAASETPLTFAEIERIIGGGLPASAFKYPAWWSNNPSNNVMTKAWLDAGYKSERVDLGSQRLVFRRAKPPGSSGSVSRPAPAPSTPPTGGDPLKGLYGALRGTVRLRADVDLTAPTGEVWTGDRD